MSRTHHHPGLLFVCAPCAGHQPTTDQGSKEIVTSVESGATSPQNALNAQAALLRGQACIDTQRTKSFCCKAAGITSPSSTTPLEQTPHDRLRRAAPADTTLIAPNCPPAQLVEGYTRLTTSASPQSVNLQQEADV